MADPPKYLINAVNYVGWKLETGSTLSDVASGLAHRYPRLTPEETSFALEQGRISNELADWANVAPEQATLRQTAEPGAEFGPEVEVTVRATVLDEHGNRRHRSEKVTVSPDMEIGDVMNAAAAQMASRGGDYEEFSEADLTIDHINFFPDPE